MRWAESAALRAAIAMFGGMAPARRMRVARALGTFAARWVPIRRKVVEEQLLLAFPEMSSAERSAIVEKTYVHLVALGLEILALHGVSREGLADLLEMKEEDSPELRKLLDSGKGFVVVTAHMGNWEWGGAYFAGLVNGMAYAAKPMHDPVGEAFISGIRDRFGLKPVSTRESPRRMMGHLMRVIRGGGIAALPADQDARRSGIFVDFFGHPAATFEGPAWLSYKLGVPLIPMFGARTPEGKLRYVWEPAIWPDTKADAKAEIRRITEYHVRALERAIRADPSQYLWFHRRWKTKPRPDEPNS